MKNIDEDTREQKLERLIGFTKTEKIGLGLLLILIAISPILFSQFSWKFSFQDTGAIGDTIGGITAPFVNLLAAYLVYKSFTAQIRANAQQRNDHEQQMKQLNKEHSFNYISNYFELIKKKYPILQIEPGYQPYSIKGIYIAVDNFVDSDNYRIATKPENLNHENEIIRNSLNDDIIKLKNRATQMNAIINKCVKQLLDQINTIILFTQESEKSEIDEGIKKFYKLELEKIIIEMNLSSLFDQKWLDKLIEADSYLNNENKIEIEQLKSKTSTLQTYGYPI